MLKALWCKTSWGVRAFIGNVQRTRLEWVIVDITREIYIDLRTFKEIRSVLAITCPSNLGPHGRSGNILLDIVDMQTK